MNYSLNLLGQQSEADALLQMATRDKRNFINRKESLEIRTEHSAESVAERAAELTAAKSEQAAAVALIGTLPEGEAKEDQETKKMELDLKIRKLSKAKSAAKTDDAVTVLQNEYKADLKERQISGMDAFIAAVTERKAALQ